MTGSLEARLQSLEDERALRQLIGAYTQRGDALDWEGWAELFAEDAIFDIPGAFGTLSGRKEIHDVSKAALGTVYQVTQHYIINLDFAVDGDRATGRGDLLYAALPDQTRPTGYYLTGGRYSWTFIRTNVGWRIYRATLNFLWNNGVGAESVFAGEHAS
jgi:ketosteroid isomerase-like protein